jgi:hypothetical protein
MVVVAWACVHAGAALAQQIGFEPDALAYQQAYGSDAEFTPNAYEVDPLVMGIEEPVPIDCVDVPLECGAIGSTQPFCGESYLCAARGTLAADAGEPDFRACVDACLAGGIRKQQQCNADYRNDLAWCDREYKPGNWQHDMCYYFAGQTRNLCRTAEGASTAACLSGCGIGAPIRGIWKKIAR